MLNEQPQPSSRPRDPGTKQELPLGEHLEHCGHWLFQRRGFLPIVLVALIGLAMREFHYLGGFHEYQELWALGCLAVSLSGLGIRAFVVGHTPRYTSGRNTSTQIAGELNTTGMYSIVRHPLYLGNFLIWLGIVAFCLVWWLTLAYVLLFCLYYERIMLAEEGYLRAEFGAQFTVWAARTPAFFPNPWLWRPPALPFSLRNVLRREYTALFGIFAAFAILEYAEHLVVEHRLAAEPMWTVFLLLATTACLILRALKRHTVWLCVEGR